jgi:endoglucanase
MSGVQKEVTLDAGGGTDVGWIDNGDWMDYSFNAPAAGTYTVNLRIATPNSGAQAQLKNAAGTVLGTATIQNTNGYQNWQTTSFTVTLAAGQQTLRLQSSNASLFNINWLEFVNGGAMKAAATSAVTEATSLAVAQDLSIFPNPVTDRFAVEVNNNLTGKLAIDIISVSGTVVKQFSLTKASAGATQSYLSIGTLPAGQYILKATMTGWAQSANIVKQ